MDENQMNNFLDSYVKDITTVMTERKVINNKFDEILNPICDHVYSLGDSDVQFETRHKCYSKFEDEYKKYTTCTYPQNKEKSVHMMRVLAACMHCANFFSTKM